MNTEVHKSFQIMAFSRYRPRNGNATSYNSSIFSFFYGTSRLFSIVTIQIYISTSSVESSFFFFSHSLQHLFFVGFLMVVILTDARWFLIVVLTCISLIINVEHLFMYLWSFWTSSWKKCLFIYFPPIFDWVVWFLLILGCMSCLCILEINHLSVSSLQMFSPILWVVFSLCLKFPLLWKNF